MKVAVALAVLLLAGCTAPEVSFADALGTPGCSLRHPDGSDACHPNEQPLTVLEAPPPEWLCLADGRTSRSYYALYKSAVTGHHGMVFEDLASTPQASGLVVLKGGPSGPVVLNWTGTNAGFVSLGRPMAAEETLTLYVYDFAVQAEGEATRASVQERWTAYDEDVWLSYEVTFDNATYTLSGMVPGSLLGAKVTGFPVPIKVGNEAGRLNGTFAWNGGAGFSSRDLPTPFLPLPPGCND